METPKSSSSSSRGSVRVTDKKPCPKRPLVSSPAEAEREIAELRGERERLEAGPTAADADARASLI